jgi:hypothetical protein
MANFFQISIQISKSIFFNFSLFPLVVWPIVFFSKFKKKFQFKFQKCIFFSKFSLWHKQFFSQPRLPILLKHCKNYLFTLKKIGGVHRKRAHYIWLMKIQNRRWLFVKKRRIYLDGHLDKFLERVFIKSLFLTFRKIWKVSWGCYSRLMYIYNTL